MLIVHASYNSRKHGLVEFQLQSIPKKGQIPIYLVTFDKIPQEDEATGSELRGLLNNGYKWTITTIEPIVKQPINLEREIMQELFELLALLSDEIPDEERPQKLLNVCTCPSCKLLAAIKGNN